MSTTMNIKKAMLSPNKTLVDENNLEIKPNSVIHCLGLLFQVMDTGLRHIVGKKIVMILILQILIYIYN